MTRQAYVQHPSKTLVFWTYKAASTSLVHSLAYDVFGVPPGGTDPRVALAPTLVGWPEALGFVQQGYASIGLIREPYDRLISAFLHIFVARENVGITRMEHLEVSGRRGYDRISGGDQVFRGLTFRQFVEHCLKAIKERKGEPDLDGHWNTQIPFAFLDSGFRYDHLFTTDRTTDFFAKLAELVGLPIHERKENLHKRSGLTPRSLVDVNSLEYCGDGQLRHPENFDDEELRRAVEAAYTPDYAYFRMAAFA